MLKAYPELVLLGVRASDTVQARFKLCVNQYELFLEVIGDSNR